MLGLCLSIVVCAWILAHHVLLHLGELTNLGGQRAVEAVGPQQLGRGGEGPNESVLMACVDHTSRETMNESAQL